MTKQKYAALTVLLTLGILAVPACVVLIVDPFFFFHKPFFFREMLFEENSRYQNAGLIRSVLGDPARGIDSFIIGTSMSENFPVEKMKNAQGANILKLTVAGGRPKELALIARKAIETGRIKNIVWEVFLEYANPDPEAVHPDAPLPEFLYDDSVLNDARYVFNQDVFKKSVKLFLGKYKKRSTLENLYRWEMEKDFQYFSSPESLQQIRARLAQSDCRISPDVPDAARVNGFPNIDKNLLDIIVAHPEINFSLFFPPVSYFEYANRGNDKFWKELQMREYLLGAVHDMKNVRVYGYDLIDGIGDTLTIYRDSQHYRPWVNALMAKSMQEHTHQLTLDSWPRYQRQLIRRINKFTEKTKSS